MPVPLPLPVVLPPATVPWTVALPAQIEVVGAGVQTTVFPQASAGAIASAAMVYGQFHGVITPTTPRGTRLRR